MASLKPYHFLLPAAMTISAGLMFEMHNWLAGSIYGWIIMGLWAYLVFWLLVCHNTLKSP